MAPRSKPRVTHVRTGCVTCKRRRVKCPEEHPHCSRCIQGGFICAGYAVPQTWIFRSGIEAEKKPQADLMQPGACRDRRFMDSDSLVRQLGPIIQMQSAALVHSPLQLGNSDPFNAYAIPIGPHESRLVMFYKELVVPRMYPPDMHIYNDMQRVYLECLKDEAAACALFAHYSAMEGLTLKGRHATPSTAFFSYLSRSCAALRHSLSLMDGSETAHVVSTTMWAVCFLAATEIVNTRFTIAEVHLRAMSLLVVRYTDLTDGKPETLYILVMTFLDTIRACTTLSRPMIDTYRWFPSLFREMWNSIEVPYPNSQAGELDFGLVHPDIKDKLLRTVILSRREDKNGRYRFLQTAEGDSQDLKLPRLFLLSQLIFQYNQLLHVSLDALERLKSPKINSKQMQIQSVRAYLSVSLLLWVQITVPISPFTTDTMFDFSSNMLRHLKTLIRKDLLVQDSLQSHKQAYSDTRLWALFVAVQTQLRKTVTLGPDIPCDEWFLQTFRAEAKSRRLHSWQQAVSIFEQFLHNDRAEPHISQWWDQVVLEQSLVTMEQTEHGHIGSRLESI